MLKLSNSLSKYLLKSMNGQLIVAALVNKLILTDQISHKHQVCSVPATG